MAEFTILSALSSNAVMMVVLIVSIIVVVVLVVAGTLAVIYLRRYKQFKCVIWERDGFGQLQQSHDGAGIFIDRKTKNKRLFLRKNKVGLNPDSIPYIKSEKNRTIYLYRTGLKNFHFIQVGIKDPDVTLTVGEEDVNWSINAYERQKKLFQHSFLMQILPFVTIAFVTIIILVIFIYFFKEFATLGDMARAMKEAAIEIARAKSGTTVLT